MIRQNNILSTNDRRFRNLTGAASDVILDVGEVGKIVYSSATSVNLRTLCNAGIYNIRIFTTAMASQSAAIDLRPNGNNYTDKFVRQLMQVSVGSVTNTNKLTVEDNFQLGAGILTFADLHINTIAKQITSRSYFVTNNSTPYNEFFFSAWTSDGSGYTINTTAWDSIGTINFASQSGVILIERLH